VATGSSSTKRSSMGTSARAPGGNIALSERELYERLGTLYAAWYGRYCVISSRAATTRTKCQTPS
jgi:hypothetical protein